jgi:hypothetical protein
MLLNTWPPGGFRYLQSPITNAHFSPKMTLYSTYSEQTAWFLWFGMGWKVPAGKRYLFVHLAGNMPSVKLVPGREGNSSTQLWYLKACYPLPRILRYTRSSVLPYGTPEVELKKWIHTENLICRYQNVCIEVK